MVGHGKRSVHIKTVYGGLFAWSHHSHTLMERMFCSICVEGPHIDCPVRILLRLDHTLRGSWKTGGLLIRLSISAWSDAFLSHFLRHDSMRLKPVSGIFWACTRAGILDCSLLRSIPSESEWFGSCRISWILRYSLARAHSLYIYSSLLTVLFTICMLCVVTKEEYGTSLNVQSPYI